ncbi:MAG: ComEC/Rec2 family competence protein [Oceanicaulis sp.]
MVADTFPLPRDRGRFETLVEAVFGAPVRPGPPDPSRLLIWAPVALAIGAVAYLVWPSEPPAWLRLAAAGLAVVFALAAVLARGRAIALYVLVLAALCAAGFGLAQHRTIASAPPPIEDAGRPKLVEGWIEAVERGGSRPRLLIRVLSLEGAEIPPRRVRVRTALDDFAPGDSVSVIAMLDRPPGPAAPGGYDGGRAAWYDGVALTGWSLGRLQPGPEIETDRFARRLAAFRWMLAERIRERAGERTGGIAAALLTGDRSGVSEADAEALRLSGLGHILAISGLHMALFAGGVYWAARWLFAAIEPYARAQDPRKPAAIVALLAATAYLVLSGAAVPTQRAWVMAVVVLLGVLFDRRAFSLRSLAIAAIGVLVIAPESVIEPGFQMSFSAVAALIAVYEIWMKIKPERLIAPGVLERAMGAFGGLATTSLVAGAATGAFAAFHFQRLAAYGFIANLLAMPVFTFLVMPAGVAALALMPFGLDGPMLRVMDLGLRVVLAVAHRTAETEGAGVSVLAASGTVVALYGVGFALATLGLGLVRAGGIAASLAALAAWQLQSPPDFMVTEDGVVLARFDAEAGFQATDLRRGRFDTGVFLQRAGAGEGRPDRAALACDAGGCTGRTADGLLVAITEDPEALAEDCERADIVVFDGRAPPWRARRCGALLFDDARREEIGGAAFWIKDGRVVRLRAAQDRRRSRVWSAPPGGT